MRHCDISNEEHQALPAKVRTELGRQIESCQKTVSRSELTSKPTLFERLLYWKKPFSKPSDASVAEARSDLPIMQQILQDGRSNVMKVYMKDIGVVWTGDESEDWPMFYCGTSSGLVLTFDGLGFADKIVSGSWPSTEIHFYWRVRHNGRRTVIASVAAGDRLTPSFTWDRESCVWPYRPQPPYFRGELRTIAESRSELTTPPVDDDGELELLYSIVH
jgi:hypothetical protein